MNKKINLRSLTLCSAMLFVAAINASAHEKWFYENETYELRWDLFFRPLPHLSARNYFDCVDTDKPDLNGF